MQHSIGQDQLGQPPAQMMQMNPQVQVNPQMQVNPQVQMGQQVQMMYSPVRLVYDPGMMMQQEQMQQQNQNMFINQPPWARPVQNQVIYVQQIGPNLVPIQHIDPNVYIQQNPYTGVQQMVQNIQNLPQGQLRPIMGSLQQPNMMQNYIPNMQGIATDPQMGQIITNYGFLQANPEVNVINNVGNVNAQSNEDNRQVATQNVAQNVLNQDTQTQIYRPMVQQMAQQQNLVRPQMQIIQQLQNMTNVQNMGHQVNVVSQIGQNVAQTSQNATSNAQIGQNVGPISQNISNVAQINQNGANNIGQLTQNLIGNVSQNVVQNVSQNLPNNSAISGQNIIGNVKLNPAMSQPGNANQTPLPNQRNSVSIAQNTQNVGTNRPMVNTSVQANANHQIMQQTRQVAQTQTANIMPRNVPQNFSTTTNVDRNVNSNTVLYSAVRNGQSYTYRAIQPKPNVRMNFNPRTNQDPLVRKPFPPNVNHGNKVDNSTSMVTNVHTQIRPAQVPPVTIKTESDNNQFNRKRKSESPDEVQKKVANFGSITVTEQVKDRIKAKYSQNTSDVGINTSPVHKIGLKVDSPQPMLQINPMGSRLKEELLKNSDKANKMDDIGTDSAKVAETEMIVDNKEGKEVKDMSQQTEKAPSVRKTVFPQAKGRLLENKANAIAKPENLNTNTTNQGVQVAPQVLEQTKTSPVPISEENKVMYKTHTTNQDKSSPSAVLAEIKNLEEIKAKMMNQADGTNKTLVESKDTNSKEECKSEEKVTNALKIGTETVKESITKALSSEASSRVKIVDLRNNKEIIEKETITPEDTKMDTSEPVSKLSTDFDEIIKDNKIEKKEYKNISINDIAGKEIHIIDGNITKKERDYVLTHVLDGYVIQESNVPFAIRKPLKEKTINSVIDDKQELMRNLPKDEPRDRLLELSQLHIEETKELDVKENIEEKTEGDIEKKTDVIAEDSSEGEEKVNPFRDLKPSVVKSWTVDDLTAHLTKHNWTETMSLFQEHEIDGESLLLVTKTQLVTIGVCEEHADLICEFLQKN